MTSDSVALWALLVPLVLADALLLWVLYARAVLQGAVLLLVWARDDAPWGMMWAPPRRRTAAGSVP